jgi:hypothetical protein
VQANTYELKQILTPERRYIIPTFQRDYEWTEKGGINAETLRGCRTPGR